MKELELIRETSDFEREASMRTKQRIQKFEIGKSETLNEL